MGWPGTLYQVYSGNVERPWKRTTVNPHVHSLRELHRSREDLGRKRKYYLSADSAVRKWSGIEPFRTGTTLSGIGAAIASL